jgi:hypothetical protein
VDCYDSALARLQERIEVVMEPFGLSCRMCGCPDLP